MTTSETQRLYAHVVPDHDAWYGVRSVVWRLQLTEAGVEREAVSERFRDYRQARGPKLKGLLVTYMLVFDACYEEQRRKRRREAEHVFFVVESGRGIRYLSEGEVEPWLIRRSAR